VNILHSEKFHRRKILELMGSGILLYPFMNMLRATGAYGALSPGRRVILVFMGSGGIQFWPEVTQTTSHAGVSEEYFPEMAKPLFPLKDQVNLFKGLSFLGPLDHFEGAERLFGGPSQAFAGGGGYQHSVGAQASARELLSLDNFLLQNNNIGSFYAGYGTTVPNKSWYRNILYKPDNKGGSILDFVNDDPLANFNKFFGNLNLSKGMQLQAAGDIASGRKGLIDFVMDDYKKVASKLGFEDRHIFDQYMSILNELSDELNTQKSMEGNASLQIRSAQCTQDAVDALSGEITSKSGSWYHLPENLPLLADLNRRMMVQAFSCGAQLGVMQFGCGQYEGPLRFTGENLTVNDLHMADHAQSPEFLAGQKAVIQQVVNLALDLKNISSPGGAGTLLDETTIFVTSCFGNASAHNATNIPCVTIGGPPVLRKGQTIVLDGTPGNYNRLLTSLAHVAGHTEVNQYGIHNDFLQQHKDATSGVIEEMFA